MLRVTLSRIEIPGACLIFESRVAAIARNRGGTATREGSL